MSAPQASIPPSCFLAAAGGLGGDGGDDSPPRRHPPLTHAVDANPAFPDEEDANPAFPDEEEKPDPNPNDGNNYDPTSAAFVGAAQWRKKKRAGITPTLPCPACGKEFANPKALRGHMRCHPDRTWRGITPPALQPESEEVAASLANPKALHGHMRCHPDRTCRGITPPALQPETNPKTLHGHMRCHPNRTWWGITPPALQPESEEVAASLVRLSGREGACVKRYRCSRCGKAFDTYQALGGHRASHKTVMGCHAKSGGHAVKRRIQMKICQRRRMGRRKTLAEAAAETVKEAVAVETDKEMVTDMVRQTTEEEKEEEAEVVSETAEEVAAVEAVAERRGLLLDLNLPAPPEDKNDDPSAGIIDLNKKLPGQDDE